MKKIQSLLLVLLMLVQIPALGQKLSVRDFSARPQDMDAQSNTFEKKDRNGKRAAIIKIFTSLPSTELTFGGSGQGFVGQEQHGPGQVWLYVPRASQKVTISHPKYDPYLFYYPSEIKEGCVYSMILSPEGKEVSLSASARNAEIWIDGENVGVSPVNTYIPYGTHAVRAKLGSLLFDDDIVVERDGASQFSLQMVDENLKYGDVVVDVDGGAELWFQGRREGVGRFAAHLRGDDYIIEARKADHDPATTTFKVIPGQMTHVKATPPTPHLGFLKIATVPQYGVSVIQGDSLIQTESEMQLPVANYEWTFSRKGYEPVTRNFHINRGETLVDTVTLSKIQYVKPCGLYAGAGFTYSKMPGVTLFVGGLWRNVDLSFAYTFGITKSKPVDWYQDNTELFFERTRYRMDDISFKAGYQFALAERFGITPQIGYLAQMLHGEGSKGNGFTCSSISAGVKLTWVPVPRVGIYINPDYAIPVSAGGEYSNIAKFGGFSKGGFNLSVGAYIYIL